ncbi:uncharacterized protein si:dkey-192k22.2 isoform X2 [Coregonus clupeaformis]|uniref:uncharacterized protein si:dkey-192k22.2 isoform X2 n=1 Tax=Coregonus clupeaformis TaxID=59861 RepID=UPI001E1C73F8|nr:uncharacterized protein si:dkey-192k22.2 isoform X2 [Coregonus clupeaformis]
MTRAALIKLLIFILLAFIICLPEFFTSHRVRVNFHCVTFDLCGDQEVTSQCDPRLTPAEQNSDRSGEEKPVCTGNTWRNGTGSGLSWLLCDTETDLPALHGNASLSGRRVALSVLSEGGNVTLYGLLTEEKKEREEEWVEEGQGFIYCCLQTPPLSIPTNHSQCLVHLHTQGTNQTAVKSDLPWTRPPRSEWLCVFRMVWLVLLVVVLLIVLTTVLGLIHWRTGCCRKKPRVYPASVFQTSGFNTDLLHVSVSLHPSSELLLSGYGTTYWTGLLSPIHEEKTAALHHRGHPLPSSLSPEEL